MLGRIRQNRAYTARRAEIAGLTAVACTVCLPLSDNIHETRGATDRRTGYNAKTCRLNIANYGVSRGGKPEPNSGIENLMARGIPAEVPDQTPRFICG